jgi:CelD/BcsL family acetyltransferase involved in cellulose biosynthesis
MPHLSAPGESRLTLVDDWNAIRAEWSALSKRDGCIFGTWEWASTWWRHFGGGRRLLLTASRRPDGSIAALLPAYEALRRPVRAARFVGHGPGDLLGPVSAPEDRPAAAAALGEAVDGGLWGCRVFFAEKLDATWAPLIGGRVLRREVSPVLRTEGRTWEDFLASVSPNLREQMRARERRLSHDHDVRFRLSQDRRSLNDDLEMLFRLHDARWAGGVSPGFVGRNRDFHREFARVALTLGWLRLWMLEVDGRPAAAWYGFRFGNADWYYQAGRDPSLEQYSVGFVLLVHTIREAFRDGVSAYRFGRGDQPYKQRFASEAAPLETRALSSGLLGACAVHGARAALRLPLRGRELIAGLAR